MSDLSVFDFSDHDVRVLMVEGEPWWIAKDVCDVLEISNSRQALSRIDGDMKGVISNDTLGGAQSMATVSEAGLYELIFASRKSIAKAFRRWVFSEVLPQIRKTGKYAPESEPAPQPTPAPAIAPVIEAERWLGVFKALNLDQSPRHVQVLSDRIANLLGDNALTAAAEPELLGVVEIAEALGFDPYQVKQVCSQLGKVVAAWHRKELDQEPITEKRLVNGRACTLKVYRRTEELDTMVSSFLIAKGLKAA